MLPSMAATNLLVGVERRCAMVTLGDSSSGLWSSLSQASNVAQLVGVDALGLVSMVGQAVLVARRHWDACWRLAQHVELVGGLLRDLELSEICATFVRLAKKAQRPVKKSSCGRAAAARGGGGEGCRVVRLMAQAREMVVSLLETTLRLLPKQIGCSSRRARKWALVSKRFQSRKVVVCKEQQLRSLERSMGEHEDGVEFLFRRLIRSRVSLLNILSS